MENYFEIDENNDIMPKGEFDLKSPIVIDGGIIKEYNDKALYTKDSNGDIQPKGE